jgi:hypothetical protein
LGDVKAVYALSDTLTAAGAEGRCRDFIECGLGQFIFPVALCIHEGAVDGANGNAVGAGIFAFPAKPAVV